ncbi:MAG TPA: ferritin-like domain-containing protein [Clostridiaceae bacterium]|nr:ferritin-like domain-containing protein [Clostridiaceae bacterium]
MINPEKYSTYLPNFSTMADNIYTYPNNLPGALELIKEAVVGETEDRNLYEFLSIVAPTKEEKNLIKGIMEDEVEHFELFRQIYYELTGQMLPAPKETKIKKPSSYCEGIKKALTGEQNTSYKYAKILFAMSNRIHMMKLVKIILDELRHGTLFNYIYSKNRCK